MKRIKATRPKRNAEKKAPHRVKVGSSVSHHAAARHALGVGALVGVTNENPAASAVRAGGYVF